MKKLLYLSFLFSLLLSCTETSVEVESKPKIKTLKKTAHPAFLKKGKLVAIIDNNITSYYINKGQPRGFEYDMLKAFCKEYNIDLEVKMVNNVDFIVDSIVLKKADIGAGNLTITGERKRKISFSTPLLKTKQVIVQALPDGYKKLSKSQIKNRVVNDALELDGQTVYVNKKSSFSERLTNLANENGLDITIKHVDENMGIDDLIDMVSTGKIKYTILDENLAHFYKNLYPNLYVKTPISLSQNIGWVINKDNLELQELINTWIEENQNTTKWNMIYNRYFKIHSREMTFLKKNFNQVLLKEVSPFDDVIKENALSINWDWCLIASIIKKESNFNPNVQSRFGATGLMQLLPNTAQRFGVEQHQLFIPAQNIKAGTRFLQWLESYWYNYLGDSTDLMPYILASYNAGPGHVQDAIKLAKKHGYNHHVWEGSVALMLQNKSKPAYYQDPVVKHGYCRGREPVHYVEEVYKYYYYYKAYTAKDALLEVAQVKTN